MKFNNKKQARLFTFLIGFTQIYAWATTYYLPAALIKVIVSDLNQNSLAIIGGFSWALFVGGLCAPKIGSWIELEGGRRPLSLGSLLMGLGLILLSQTQGLFVWYAAWTVVGLGMALGLFNAAFAAIGRFFRHEAKTIIIRVTLISGFSTLFWPLTTYLIQAVGWRTTMVLYAMPHIFIWAPLFFFNIPNWVPAYVETQVSDQRVIPEKIKLVFYLLAIYAVLRSIIGTTISVGILNMFEGLGLAISAAALIASLIGPSQIVGRLIEIYFGRNFDPLNSSIFWTAVLPASIFILVFMGVSSASIFAIAYGMSNGVLAITMGVLPMILFGSKGYAELLGKLALPVLIAQSATPLLAIPLIERLPAISVFFFAGILGLASLGCLMFLSSVSKRGRKNS
ncbi:MAG: major facilitator superfamily MFS_1 [uncultured bacterium]|nr:MAG: major facilitator superfamily MFS_1 [uncultured bacterium]OGT23686.1 MAG: hypothetical protein A2W47_01010 [Gammaproteobacteria bacterium RIFCSPHIGHO2_12_38_15]OGT77417.1 MAG: hypothetical protein A3G71_01060 [Gammaproteobacteria bacterium RIFCSPLOWO2_12_FULL_38_14]